MNELGRWQAYWKGKTAPLHHRDEEDYYISHAHELKVLFSRASAESVLEIGCGNGALYQHLDFDRAREYLGVDISDAMLGEFRKRFPNVSLLTASGHSYRDGNKYDLIFSNGVLQNFDRAMLAEHIENAAAMLAPNGRLVCASIPWRSLRRRYLMGAFNRRQRNMVWSLLHTARYWHRDSLGHWYEWQDLRQIAEKQGLTANFHGSIHYPYRFHSVMQLARPQG
jgi:cyclopropane fatty-acyl-phospholipid synthase-like methyltransferase